MFISQWMVGWVFSCTLKLSQLKCLKSFMNCYCCLVTKSCLTLCNPMGHSPPGSSVRGILQARALRWAATSSSGASSWSTSISCIGRQILYHWATWEAPFYALFNPKTVHPGQDSWGSGLLISWGRSSSVVGGPVYWRMSPSLPSFYPRVAGSVLPCPWEPKRSTDTRPVSPGHSRPGVGTSNPEAAALVLRESPCHVREPRWGAGPHAVPPP